MKMLNSSNDRLIVAALFAGLFAMVSTGAVAKPVITWDQSKLHLAFGPGDTVEFSAKFRATADIFDGSIFITSELTPFISIQSSSLPVVAGDQEEILIRVSIPENEIPGAMYDGTIHILSETTTVARPLPINLQISNETIAGVDADSNGVRDDVDLLIDSIVSPETPQHKMALDIARARQAAMTRALSEMELRDTYTLGANATVCMSRIGIDHNDLRAQILLQQTNTDNRLQAYRYYKGRLSLTGSFLVPDREELNQYCEATYSLPAGSIN